MLRVDQLIPRWVLLSLVFVACAPVLHADALDGVLQVRSAYVSVEGGVFLLHARIYYPVNPVIRDALRDGVTLTVELDTRIERERRYWFNAEVVQLMLRRELDYHAVSDRYLVRDVRTGNQKSFATLEEALTDLGTVEGWPVLIEPQLAEGSYRISVRAGVRRGRLPASLRALMFWTDDWHRVSEWYTWLLPV